MYTEAYVDKPDPGLVSCYVPWLYFESPKAKRKGQRPVKETESSIDIYRFPSGPHELWARSSYGAPTLHTSRLFFCTVMSGLEAPLIGYCTCDSAAFMHFFPLQWSPELWGLQDSPLTFSEFYIDLAQIERFISPDTCGFKYTWTGVRFKLYVRLQNE